MTICNIIDGRKNKYDVVIEAILESSFHDDSIEGATQFENDYECDNELTFLSISKTTIENVIKYVSQQYNGSITLYMYDVGTSDKCYYKELVSENGIIKII